MTAQPSPRFPIEQALRSYADDLEGKYQLQGGLLRQAADAIEDACGFLSETVGFDGAALTLGDIVRYTVRHITRAEEHASDDLAALRARVEEIDAFFRSYLGLDNSDPDNPRLFDLTEVARRWLAASAPGADNS